MNREWSEIHKLIKSQISKRATFESGIENLLELREVLMQQVDQFKKELTKEEFCAIPFINADGYHSKTIAYSLFHIFRIEDIVANTLIRKQNQIFFDKDYQKRMNASIITTGNELVKEEIAEFSKLLNIDELYQYINEVNSSTKELLKSLSYDDLSIKMTAQDAQNIQSLKAVSSDERAVWLIDYWCGKNIRGLIQMPFSRHWVMHISACLRISKKIK